MTTYILSRIRDLTPKNLNLKTGSKGTDCHRFVVTGDFTGSLKS